MPNVLLSTCTLIGIVVITMVGALLISSISISLSRYIVETVVKKVIKSDDMIHFVRCIISILICTIIGITLLVCLP